MAMTKPFVAFSCCKAQSNVAETASNHAFSLTGLFRKQTFVGHQKSTPFLYSLTYYKKNLLRAVRAAATKII
jgi:hypothetical protein